MQTKVTKKIQKMFSDPITLNSTYSSLNESESPKWNKRNYTRRPKKGE